MSPATALRIIPNWTHLGEAKCNVLALLCAQNSSWNCWTHALVRGSLSYLTHLWYASYKKLKDLLGIIIEFAVFFSEIQLVYFLEKSLFILSDKLNYQRVYLPTSFWKLSAMSSLEISLEIVICLSYFWNSNKTIKSWYSIIHYVYNKMIKIYRLDIQWLDL